MARSLYEGGFRAAHSAVNAGNYAKGALDWIAKPRNALAIASVPVLATGPYASMEKPAIVMNIQELGSQAAEYWKDIGYEIVSDAAEITENPSRIIMRKENGFLAGQPLDGKVIYFQRLNDEGVNRCATFEFDKPPEASDVSDYWVKPFIADLDSNCSDGVDARYHWNGETWDGVYIPTHQVASGVYANQPPAGWDTRNETFVARAARMGLLKSSAAAEGKERATPPSFWFAGADGVARYKDDFAPRMRGYAVVDGKIIPLFVDIQSDDLAHVYTRRVVENRPGGVDIFTVDRDDNPSKRTPLYWVDGAVVARKPVPTAIPPFFWFVSADGVARFDDDFAPGMKSYAMVNGKAAKLFTSVPLEGSAQVYINDDILKNRPEGVEVFAVDRDGNQSDRTKFYLVDGVVTTTPPKLSKLETFPKGSALAFAGNARDMEFFRRHGYSRRSPKNLGV